MNGMDRRKFIQLSLLASGAALGVPSSFAASADLLRLTLRPDRPGNAISDDFTGFSYETAQLRNPYFFSAKNTQLIGFCRRLSPSGVLRIGGNTSAFSVWTPKPGAADKAESLWDEVAGPDTGKHAAQPAPHRQCSVEQKGEVCFQTRRTDRAAGS